MESKFTILRQELINLGYTQTLKPDCVPLVDRLLSDLKTTTESLQKYMIIAQQAIEERDNLQLGAEPYKCDNAKLIRECNELHLAFIQFKEQHEKVQRELKTKIVSLQNQLESCELEKQDFQKQIKDLEVQLSKIEKKGIKVTSSRNQPSLSKVEGTRKSFQLNTAMACADQKIAYLSNEIKKLKEEQLNLVQSNELFKNQLQNRDEEISRLKNLLEGGRPLDAISKDCCYKNIDNKIGALRDEISSLKREKNTLHNQLKDALAKQHEAMRRALHLAERNKVLEKEMKDIDQIALAVEAECNSTIRSNIEKVTRLQDRMNESGIIIQNLERETHKLKQDKQELSADLDAVKLEKKHLQSILDTEREDKKRLTDRINSFTIIEHDLNLEIDRLVRVTGEQKRRIAELECRVTEEKMKASSFEMQPTFQKDYIPPSISKKPSLPDKAQKGKQTVKKTEHKSTCKKFGSKRRPSLSKDVTDGKKSPPLIAGYESQIGRCCCESDGCVKHMKELLDKEMEYRQTQVMQQMESLKQEKEYYMKEYHRVCDQIRNVPTHDKPNEAQGQLQQLLKEINEKNKTIADLQNEIHTLSKEKHTMRMKLESMTGQSDSDMDKICEKAACKRQRREFEIVRNEFKHLESENESLKSKVQSMNESIVFDQERMKRAFQEMEEHIRKLENERRDLVISQTTSRSNQAQLEEEYNQLKEQLRATQIELNNQKANYNQLKALHEQADRALSDAQNKVLRSETEMTTLQSKMSNTHRESEAHEKEICRLQGDIQYMKMQLSKIDKEKDNLLNVVDEKTEKIALLEDQLREKKNSISSLEMELKELKRKLGNFSDESSTQQQNLRSLKQEIALLQKDFENEKKQKEAAVQENRRLQNDIASVVCDCKEARKQLDIDQRQVDDLKRQLQHYVAEVKRTEDLISQKELERTEILDQFKCLSEEANILESNNHTLETEATQSRVQLSVALDHASDLERKLENQDAVIRSYEKQVTGLTSQVASLEIQLKQNNNQYDRLTTELQQMK
ncbi:centrosomal protein of 135 kDa, partial [Anoplophora glabripennis]|uniref:centrosomal protein of 135 kDa n=1 Tax=Anoplophora glabripennis TaxID=217634 RepID=UPI0008752A0A